MIVHDWSDKAIQNDIKFCPFETVEKSSKIHEQVDTSKETKTFSPEEISTMVLTKKKRISEIFLGKKVTQAIVTMTTQNCNNIPRKNQVEACKTDMHRYCEKFANRFPFPVKEQNCHVEPKKICELEMKTCTKKTKKDSYTEDC